MSDPLENYSWDSDEGWLILLKKLEFPPKWDENKKEKFLLKKKRKYYKTKVDPNYEPPIVEETTTKPVDDDNNTSSKTENINTENNNNNSKEPLKNPFEDDDEERKSEQPEPKSKPEPKQKSKQRSTPTSTSRGGSFNILSKLLNYYYVFSQLFVLIGSVLCILNPLFFRYVLIVSALMYLVSLLQNHGRPQFNQYFMERIMKDENLMILFYSFMFLLAQPSIIFLIPLTLRSIYMSAFMLNSILNNMIPSLTNLFNKIISKGVWFTNQIAIIEVYIGIYLIICIFWMRNSIILAIMYWQINGLKYTMNDNTKTAFWRVNQTFENYLGKIPILLTIYKKVTGYMYSMVDPERLRQQAQQAQNGGFGKRCIIM